MNVHVSPTARTRSKFSGATTEMPPAADPIFDMIESHRREHAAHCVACDKDNQREMDRAGNATRALAMTLVKAPATTLPGLAALLHYAYDFVRDGNQWPNWVGDASYDWSAHLNRSAAEALEKIACV
jgi:hypothetical protein